MEFAAVPWRFADRTGPGPGGAEPPCPAEPRRCPVRLTPLATQAAERLAPEPLVSPQAWARELFGAAQLADRRLARRLVRVAATLCEKPRDSLPQAHEDWGQTKATYRFLENDRVGWEPLAAPMAEATARQCARHGAVLAVQDTTTLTFPTAPGIEGLGYITDLDVPGLLVHSTLALRLDGMALGLLDMQIWARDNADYGCTKNRKQRPIEEKESRKWLRGIAAARAARDRATPPEARPRLIHVFDREGDIHEVFEAIDGSGDGAVIRVEQNRRVQGDGGALDWAYDRVRRQNPLGRVTLDVPRNHGRPARQASVQVRSCPATLRPRSPHHPRRRAVSLWLVEVWEDQAPAGQEPLHWRLWTTEPAATFEQALEVVAFYKQRWRIEDVHLVLKEGCRVEDLTLRTFGRLAKAIVLYAAVAVRVVQLRDWARLDPHAPATVVLSDLEWRALFTRIHKQRPDHNTPVPSLRQATLWIGRLGGHLGRKGDGMPGVRTLWRGLRDLEMLTALYEILQT